MIVQTLTKELLGHLRARLGEQNFQTWISPIRLTDWKDGVLTIEVPSKFFRDWLEEHYRGLIEETGRGIMNRPVAVNFLIGAHPPELTEEPVARPAHAVPGPLRLCELNPKYSFNRFVVGPCNSFAHAAALAVAQRPGKSYNPLFIYGGVGLGKTHLMQAIAQEVIKGNPAATVLYLSSESFTNEFINAIAKNTTDRFRKKYRSVDLLLIDDIHFMSGQPRTQEQFFHTFNALWDSHKQIVLCSDRPPKEIPDVEERLISRFEWGLVVDLQPAERETRIAILRKEAEWSGIAMPDEIIDFIADRIKSNIRKLEGAFIQVASYASLTNVPLSREVAEMVLGGIMEDEVERAVTIDEIQRTVAEFFDIRVADMKSSRRPKSIAFPRQVAMYLSRGLTRSSLNEVGESFGGRDHTTVLHACSLIESRKGLDGDLAKTLSFLEGKIRKAPR
jgi:chromosomal replication initiator protein